jgi:hypothetical protein
MTDFGSETFRRVSTLLTQTAEDCLHNVACLKEAAVRDPLPELRTLDTTKVADLLCSESKGTKTYSILAQAVPQPNKPDGTAQLAQLIWTGPEQRYRLNSVIVNANGTLLVARNGGVDVRKSAAGLGATYDDAALRAIALSEAYLHCSKVADIPDVGQLLMMLFGMFNHKDPLDDARREAAGARFHRLREEYAERLSQKVTDLRNRAFDRSAIEKSVPGAYINYMPMYLTEDDAPGSRIVNDVWFPERYATPLMQSLAEAQARAMSSQGSQQAKPKGWISRLLGR